MTSLGLDQWSMAPTMLTALAVVFVSLLWIHLIRWGLALAVRRIRRGTGSVEADRQPDTTPPDRADVSVVACPECDTPNEAGYRYCRECVSKLPQSMTFRRNSRWSGGRLLGPR